MTDLKAWLFYSVDSSAGGSTNSSSSTCRNKLDGFKTFGDVESDTSNCVEFCELHVDSSGNIFYINDTQDFY